jgi:O-antigen/teichoic acid export membrane protein
VCNLERRRTPDDHLLMDLKEPELANCESARKSRWEERYSFEGKEAGLKQTAIRGGVVVVASQGAKFGLRLGGMMMLSRLLTPHDFGLVGMAAVVTSFLGLFRDAGLSQATIQRGEITHAQVSALFWANIGIGLSLAGIIVGTAPLIAVFYNEPRLVGISWGLASTFVLNALSTQHQALLQRRLQFIRLATIDIASLLISTGVGVLMALNGFGFWSLVGMYVAAAATGTIGVWAVEGWIPGLPKRGSGVRGMLHFGGVISLNTLTMYLAYNAEKLLLGRYWGADALGLYGRAYQLANLPVDQLHSSIGTVAFSALPRLQDDPGKLAHYFLQGYSLVLCITVPVTVVSLLLSNEIIGIALGPNWTEAAIVFQLLAPTVLVFGLINPFGWLLVASGKAVKSMKIGFVIAPLVMGAYMIGLDWGPKGVAASYSIIMILMAAPLIVWFCHGTPVKLKGVLSAVRNPTLAGIGAAGIGLVLKRLVPSEFPVVVRFTLIGGLVMVAYALLLLWRKEERLAYWSLVLQIRPNRRER